MSKVVISLSGGMDSTTLLHMATKSRQPGDVLAVSFAYGSKHNRHEVAAASQVASTYRVATLFVDASAVFRWHGSDLLLTGGDVPDGHYEAESMRRTVVPGRNLVFAAILAGIAESRGFGEVQLGVHAGDHHIYPDCRPEFVSAAGDAVYAGSDRKVKVLAPFLHWTKAKILEYGLRNGVVYGMTRTCYKDQAVACGRCGSCQERLAAFAEIGSEDPLKYESREILPKEGP